MNETERLLRWFGRAAEKFIHFFQYKCKIIIKKFNMQIRVLELKNGNGRYAQSKLLLTGFNKPTLVTGSQSQTVIMLNAPCETSFETFINFHPSLMYYVNRQTGGNL